MIKLEPEEYIVKEVRKHWFFILTEIISSVFTVFIPFMIIVVLFFLEDNPTIYSIKIYTIALTPLWVLLTWITFFYFWTDYYLDVITITNKRIVYTEQNGLFNRKMSSFSINRIQDIIIIIPGILSTFLRFGNIEIKTAGDNNGFTMANIAEPEETKKIIFDLQKTIHTRS